MYSENSKIVICLDSFSKQIYNILVIFRLISVFLAFIASSLRVTEVD